MTHFQHSVTGALKKKKTAIIDHYTLNEPPH